MVVFWLVVTIFSISPSSGEEEYNSPEEGKMPKRRDNKTKRRPQEDKQDNNKEEWNRKDYNHVHNL